MQIKTTRSEPLILAGLALALAPGLLTNWQWAIVSHVVRRGAGL